MDTLVPQTMVGLLSGSSLRRSTAEGLKRWIKAWIKAWIKVWIKAWSREGWSSLAFPAQQPGCFLSTLDVLTEGLCCPF